MRLNALVVAFFVASVAAPVLAQTSAGDEYEAEHYDVDPRGKVKQGGTEIKESEFFERIGRNDLVQKVKDAQTSSIFLGVGLGAGGIVALIGGYGGAIGFSVVASENPSSAVWSIPAAIGTVVVGWVLFWAGLVGGAVVGVIPQLNEPDVLDKAELEKLANDANAKTRARLGLPPKVAMRLSTRPQGF